MPCTATCRNYTIQLQRQVSCRYAQRNATNIPVELCLMLHHCTLSQMCLVHKAGSLSVVEYGSNDVLAVCRTEHMSPYLLSAADVEARGTSPAVKRVAYLLDLQTIRVIDLLAGGQSLATISHDAKIDWLVRVAGLRAAACCTIVAA